MYVIMLDYLIAQFPNDWPVSGKNDDIEVLRQQATHDGNPQLIGKNQYSMRKIEPKNLRNVRTGRLDAGSIYAATRTTP